MSKMKLLLSALVLIIVTVIATTSLSLVYLMRQDNLLNVIIKYQNDESSIIPASIYEIYLYTSRWTPKDIEELNTSVGINAFYNDEDKTIDEKLFYFLLDKGLNVNQAHEMTGLYPLHQATLANDLNLVRLLLLHGADPTIEAKYHKLNSLDFTRKLMERRPDIDRKPIELILLEHLQNDKQQKPGKPELDIRN